MHKMLWRLAACEHLGLAAKETMPAVAIPDSSEVDIKSFSTRYQLSLLPIHLECKSLKFFNYNE